MLAWPPNRVWGSSADGLRAPYELA